MLRITFLWTIFFAHLPSMYSSEGLTYTLPCSTNPCGLGVCYMLSYADSSKYFCRCPTGYISSKMYGYRTCINVQTYFQRYSGGLMPFSNPLPGSNMANRYFRHLSAGYASEPGQMPTWNYTERWNWADKGALSPIKDQMGCKACSSFSTAEAMESLYYIADPSVGSPPSISVQQFLDCQADSCNGGWPVNTLRYAGENDLVTDAVLPYTAVQDSNNCTDTVLMRGLYSIAMFEQVSHLGWFGLLLAVQQQPVMVAIESSSLAFHSYTKGVFDDPDCYWNGLDHTVVVVGYDLTAKTPHWIIRNSWGVKWGEKGYMRMAITAGDGVCGINVIPGFYPVINRQSNWDPCFRGSYGSVNNVPQGRQNPCGGGVCNSYLFTYTCTCKHPFVVVTNVDGSQTCAPESPCGFYDKNPCGVGTCRNSIGAPGNYTCLCPLGYKQAVMAVTRNPTCTPASRGSGQELYTIPESYNISCTDVYTVYGMSFKLFAELNPAVDCTPGKLIPAGTVLNVTNDLGECEVTYSVNTGDNCSSIEERFWPQLTTNISGPGSPNPDLDCNQLDPGQLICLERGTNETDNAECTIPYTLSAHDTCQSIIEDQFDGDSFKFYKYNPGFYCDRLAASVGKLNFTNTQVCLEAVPFGSVLNGCQTGKNYVVKAGDTCFKVIGTIYKTVKKFSKLNQVSSCSESMLVVGRKLCAP